MSDVSNAKVWLVGAGPGAADLLTLRAARLIEQADIVFCDALVGSDIRELAPNAVWVNVGKRCGAHSLSQAEICEALVEATSHYTRIVRLKGGDPMIFGRAEEELDALRAIGVDVEVVPGVTAACAAAASLQSSLTTRGARRSIAFATPSTGRNTPRDDAWLKIALAADATALYMAGNERAAIAQALIAAGKPLDTPIAIATGVSKPTESWVHTHLRELLSVELPASNEPRLVLLGVPPPADKAAPVAQSQMEEQFVGA